jgi:copper(I)-binding protein
MPSRLLQAAPGFLLALALSLAGTAAAQAHDYKLGSLEIHHPWARPTTGKTGAAYFVIENKGKGEDALLRIESGAAAKVQLHEMKMDGVVMRMRAVGRLAIPAGGRVSVEPGGLHVMLIGLKTPLADGASFPMTLVFEKAGSIDVSVEVQTAEEMRADEAEGGAGMPGMSGGTGGMPGMGSMH